MGTAANRHGDRHVNRHVNRHHLYRHDGALVGRAACGDESAWGHLITRYHPYLGAIGRAYHLTPEELSDAVQETWLRAVANLSYLRDHTRFRSWLATLMRRSCAQVIHRERYDRELPVGDMGDVGAAVGGALRDERVDIEHEVMSAERASVLRQALRLLPVREYELLHQIATDDPSYEEITRRLEMPLGSVGPTRMRALRRLRMLLQQTQSGDLLLTTCQPRRRRLSRVHRPRLPAGHPVIIHDG